MPSKSMYVSYENLLPKSSAKAFPENKKLIKNIANTKTIKTIKTFFMKFLLLQKPNSKIMKYLSHLKLIVARDMPVR